jgi:hypothetical protein
MSNTPKRFLTCLNDETVNSTKMYDLSQKSLSGVILDYTEGNVAPVSDFSQVIIDPSMVTYANNRGISLGEYMEELDPSSNYSADSPLGKVSALQRQYIRFGFKSADPKSNEPRATVPLSYTIAHTPANSALFGSFLKDMIFWEPIRDAEYDPNMLFAYTRIQKEDTYKQIRVNDSQFRNRRLHRIGENAEVPVSHMTQSGYTGTMIKHGIGLAFSQEFADNVEMKLFAKAVQRAGLRERKSYFEHVISTLLSGDSIYGLTTGATVTKADVYDSTIAAAGEISYFALSSYLHNMRPYKPNLAIQNLATYHSYISATPPSNMIEFDQLRVLAQTAYPEMPRLLNTDFLGQSPSALITADGVIADNLILTIDTKESIARVVKAGGEVNDTGYDMQHQNYKQISTIIDGIEILPSFRDACQVLSLTLTT